MDARDREPEGDCEADEREPDAFIERHLRGFGDVTIRAGMARHAGIYRTRRYGAGTWNAARRNGAGRQTRRDHRHTFAVREHPEEDERQDRQPEHYEDDCDWEKDVFEKRAHAQHTLEVLYGFAKLPRLSRVRPGVASAVAEQSDRVTTPSVDRNPDDTTLVLTALAGAGDTFGTLVERYERAVYHLCLRTMRNGDEARDCTQEAFFKAYRGLATFKPGSKFSTWIFSIAYHACCDRLAKRKRYSDEEVPERADAGPDPGDLAAQNEAARALHAAIDGLPEKYRTVVTLYHLQGKQYEEIAQVLDLPLGTVKTHLFRAKEVLRKALTSEGMSD